jgi:hypothetical protein
MESQIHEGGADGNAGLFPADETGRQKRREEVRRNLARAVRCPGELTTATPS